MLFLFMGNLVPSLCFFVLTSCFYQGHPWGLFSSPTPPPSYNPPSISSGNFAEFSMEVMNDAQGSKLVEKAKTKLQGPNSCWQSAYRDLFSSCSEILAEREKQSRLAWHLSDCFHKDSGRPAFPTCGLRTLMVDCLKKIDEFALKIYLEFLLETNSICHQLQSNEFKREMERLVNGLKMSSQFAEEKLEEIKERSELLLQNSDQINDSLTSIDLQTQKVTQISKNAKDQILAVLKQSKAIFEQSEGIVVSQLQLQEGQVNMKERLESSVELLHDFNESLGMRIEKLKEETTKVQREINQVANSLSSKMQNLEKRADDIGDVVVTSLDKQKELLDGQSSALQGLEVLTQLQSKALEEGRANLQELAEFGHQQQKLLLQRQNKLQETHNQLIENSKSILDAQKEFESNQATIFTSLEQLFALHRAILVESRAIKAFFFYSVMIFILYMLTSTKQTSSVRAHLYLGLCSMFAIEFCIVRLGENVLDQQSVVASKIFLARSLFMLVSAIQLIHAILTFRDYDVLNHKMLLVLVDKLNSIEENMGRKWSSLSMSEDSDNRLFTLLDEELPEDEKYSDDPDYNFLEEVAENSVISTSILRQYDLRPRHRRRRCDLVEPKFHFSYPSE